MTGIQPELWVDRASAAVEFYEAAFGAVVLHRVGQGDDIVVQLAVGDIAFWVTAASPDTGRFSPQSIKGTTGRTLLSVDDPAAVLEQAVGAGARELAAVSDEHGWRLGRIVDPFGHEWEIGRPLGEWPPRDRGGADSSDPAVLAAELAAGGVVGVAISYVDNSGVARVKTFPVSRLEHAVRRGVGMSPVFDVFMFDDAISASPSSTGPVGDLRLFPDLNRLVVLAGQPGWAWAPLDRRTQAGDPHPGCQRTFARRMAERAAAEGLAARMGFEVEWVLDAGMGDDHVPATAGPAYGMDRLIEVSDYCRDLLSALAAQSVDVEQLHPEYAPAQFELSVGPTDPVAAADRILLVRHTVRAITGRAGMRCSFAPALVVGGVGSGSHLHTSLWRDGASLMTGGREPHGLSADAEAFVAGVLEGLPALLAIGAPSVASYLRLIPQRWSAPYRCWGRENREAAVRLITGSAGANAEVKCLDGAANPYLLVGAVLALGLAGVAHGRHLPREMTVDPATLSDDELAAVGVTRLPQSLDEALEHFSRCEVLAEAMGADLFGTIVALRRSEIEQFADASEEDIVRATRFRY